MYPMKDKGFKLARNVPYVPVALRARVLDAMHDDPAAGHQGVEKTLHRVTQRFWWPTVRRDVQDKVGRCHSCHVNKKLGKRSKSLLTPIPVTSLPWFDIHLDYCTLSDPSGNEKKNRACLIMVDRFTKEVELVVTKNQKDTTAIRKFTKRVLLRKGHCHSVTTDQGFGKKFTKFLKKKHIKHHTTMAYRHIGNGLAERNVRSVREYLRHYVTEASDLKMKVAECQFSLNSSIKTSTGMSPFRLRTGQEPLTELEVELNNLDDLQPPKGDPIPLLEETVNGPNDLISVDKNQPEQTDQQPADKVVQWALDRNQLIEYDNQQELILAQEKRPLEQLPKSILRNPLENRTESLRDDRDHAMANIDLQQARMVEYNQANNLNVIYKKGDLVYLDRHLETRTISDKSGTQTFGPYMVKGYGWIPDAHGTQEQRCSLCNLKMKPFTGPSPYLVVENPWVGPSSQFIVHEEDARLWSYPLPQVRDLAVQEEFQLSQLTTRAKNMARRVARYLKKDVSDLSYLDLIGRRVQVKWTKAQGAAGYWSGIVIDYEPLNDKHWIKYDVPGEDGDDTFPQNLISTNATCNWWFESTQNLVLQRGGGGVTKSTL